MKPWKKFSNLELEKLVSEGLTGAEIARKLGVHKSAVSKRLKSLNAAVTKDAVLSSAGELVDKKIDAISQLQAINHHANWLLEHVMAWAKGDPEAIQVLESQVKRVRVGENEFDVKEVKMKDGSSPFCGDDRY